MKSLNIEKLITYLQNELNIPSDSIQLALRQVEASPCQLPVALWQYGLVSLNQLNEIFAWLEAYRVSVQ